MKDSEIRLLIAVLLLVGLGVAAWYYRDLILPPEPVPVEVSAPQPVEAATDTGPKYPVPEMPVDASGSGRLVPLPPLDDSDAYFLIELGAALGPAMESLLLRDAVIDRLVTTIDNLPRGKVAEKVRPVGSLERPFVAAEADDESLILGPANYARYDQLVAQVSNTDITTAVDIYRRFYPLFQESYQRLGYPEGYFNDRVVEVIDHLLATPEPGEPVYLARPNVLYEFADPDLEALSAGQKLLLRMGPDNARRIKQVLKDFRDQID
jgi:hypothetical protein